MFCTYVKTLLKQKLLSHLMMFPIQAEMVETLFHHQRQFLASSCSDATATGGSGLMQAEEIKRIQNMAAQHVRTNLKHPTHLLSTSLQCAGDQSVLPAAELHSQHCHSPGVGGGNQ